MRPEMRVYDPCFRRAPSRCLLPYQPHSRRAAHPSQGLHSEPCTAGSPQVMQKPLDLDTIRCELPCQVDQVQLEVRELQGQVAELEKHLETSSKGNHSVLCGQQQEVSAPACIQGPSSEEVPGVPCRQQQEVSTQPVPKASGENLFTPPPHPPSPS